MIFTVGNRESYEQGLRELGPEFKKLGKRDHYQGKPYMGGSVWKTKAEADQYLIDNSPRLDGYHVYGVVADWETDTEQVLSEPFRRLLRDAPIVEARDA